MGYYININTKGEQLEAIGKARALIEDGADRTDATYKENLICVIHHPSFDAAGYMYSEKEFNEFKEIAARKTWLVHPQAKKLSNYGVGQK